ncbi:flagellar export chaperone FlgN [Pseudoalteromonas sp. T1lg65]|uniref:flagellar export chaperone FlgN n=1 Tax=Pseudoalteromonas sp. T1lg65 TaxID=2077101 RepID=UPI003F7ACB7D
MDDLTHLCIHKLNDQISSLEAMTQLLDEELNVLASRNGTELKPLAKQKLTLISQLQKVDKELSQFNPDLFKAEDVIPLVDKVKLLLNECKRKNEVNAKAAHQANLSTRELKEILLGAPTSVTYGQDGSVSGSAGELVRNLKA